MGRQRADGGNGHGEDISTRGRRGTRQGGRERAREREEEQDERNTREKTEHEQSIAALPSRCAILSTCACCPSVSAALNSRLHTHERHIGTPRARATRDTKTGDEGGETRGEKGGGGAQCCVSIGVEPSGEQSGMSYPEMHHMGNPCC